MEAVKTKKKELQWQCPMPKLDFDIITLGHGSGGTLTHDLLNAGVFDLLQNEQLDRKHDGAMLNFTGRTAVSTDSFVVSPLFFNGGNIGDLAINGTINDLAMCGAEAKHLTLSFILEEGLSMEDFWTILNSIKRCCGENEVQIITGDTKVVEKGKGDKIFINTTGIGPIHAKADIDASRIRVGDAIIISGPIARHGITIMSHREGLRFETSITSDTRSLKWIVKDLLDTFGTFIHFMRDPTRGGLATLLNEVAKDASCGINVRQSYIPLEEEVAGACEILGLDPLYDANEGLFVTIADMEVADGIVDKLHSWEHGKKAAIIGHVTSDHARHVVLQSLIGGRRIVNMLAGEQLPRIC